MITEQVLSWFGSFIQFLGSVVQFPTVPSFFGSVPGWIVSASSYVAGTGVWIPWTLLGVVIAAWMVSLGAALAVKLVRIVASFFTAGGGSAA